MKTQFTPGPWEVDSGMVQTVAERLSSGLHIPIAYMDREPNNGTLPVERDANAQLIASAPELLIALRETLAALESHLDESCRDHNLKHRDLLCPCNQNEVVRARAAIAKAEGRN